MHRSDRPNRLPARLLAPIFLCAAQFLMVGCAHVQDAPRAAAQGQLLSEEDISQLLANPQRSQADRTNDIRRKPAQLLAFFQLRRDMVAEDLSAGGGYTTELLARGVGPGGLVYGQSAPRRAAMAGPAAPEGGAPAPSVPNATAAPRSVPPPSPLALTERAKRSGLNNLIPVVQTFEDPVPPAANHALDLVTLMFNYHDLGHMGVDRAAMNRAVFAGLRPGGLYIIADHAGRAGTGISESGTLHRIEESFLRQEVEAAGFRFVAAADFLRNPNDPRDRNTPEPPQPKDDFVLKFVKP